MINIYIKKNLVHIINFPILLSYYTKYFITIKIFNTICSSNFLKSFKCLISFMTEFYLFPQI